jgi:hypothetical protein
MYKIAFQQYFAILLACLAVRSRCIALGHVTTMHEGEFIITELFSTWCIGLQIPMQSHHSNSLSVDTSYKQRNRDWQWHVAYYALSILNKHQPFATPQPTSIPLSRIRTLPYRMLISGLRAQK